MYHSNHALLVTWVVMPHQPYSTRRVGWFLFAALLDVVANAAHHVGGDGLVNLLGVRQIKVGHDRNELVQRLGEARVVGLFLDDSAAVPSLKPITTQMQGTRMQKWAVSGGSHSGRAFMPTR